MAWLSLDRTSGVGPGIAYVTAQPHTGRASRRGLVAGVHRGNTKISEQIQEGSVIVTVVPGDLNYNAGGGTIKVTVSTNVATLIAAITTAAEDRPYARIQSMTIGDITIEVQGTTLTYGVPMDPGASGLYIVEFDIKMPPNGTNFPIEELLTINGINVPIYQAQGFVPFIYFVQDTLNEVQAEGIGSFDILSNVEYDLTVEDCETEEFWNRRQSRVCIKNNCPDGLVPEPVEYVVEAGKYVSFISQEDANRQALTDIETNCQDYANRVGTCTDQGYYNDRISVTFARNDCDPGYEGTQVPYVVEAGAYFSSVSQADANNKAYAEVEANGQNYANANGQCNFVGFNNAYLIMDFRRNDCDEEHRGTIIPYVVPAGKYHSDESQAAADQQAIDEANANGQARANTQGICAPLTGGFWNVQYQQDFTKNNCRAGTGGSTVTYVVEADKYYSPDSQELADQQAIDEAASRGQDYANKNGMCLPLFYNDAMSKLFYRNDCQEGYEGSALTSTVDAGAFSSVISKDDANAKAAAALDECGQACANAEGECTFYNV